MATRFQKLAFHGSLNTWSERNVFIPEIEEIHGGGKKLLRTVICFSMGHTMCMTKTA